MKYLKNINELKQNNITDSLVEMANISNKKDFPYDVCVFGVNSFGSGRNEHGEPHFHFSDNIKNGDFEFSILIPTVEEWSQNKELYIIESSIGYYNWNGFKNEKKELISWLDKPNIDSDELFTNIEMIRLQWNILNKDNKNVKQINKIR